MFKFTLLALFSVLSAISASAQAPAACDIQIKAYAIETIRQENPPVLDGAKIVVKNSAGKIVKPSKTAANLYEKLPAGEYEIVATLAGYKTSTRKLIPVCREEIVPPAVSEYVFMWKGDPKEKVDRNLGMGAVFQISGVSRNNANINGAPVLNGISTKLVKPVYPPSARAVRASGAVNVQVTIDELGYVISAAAVSGHPLLQSAAVKAARESKFTTTTLEGIPVRVTGIIVYNFTAQ